MKIFGRLVLLLSVAPLSRAALITEVCAVGCSQSFKSGTALSLVGQIPVFTPPNSPQIYNWIYQRLEVFGDTAGTDYNVLRAALRGGSPGTTAFTGPFPPEGSGLVALGGSATSGFTDVWTLQGNGPSGSPVLLDLTFTITGSQSGGSAKLTGQTGVNPVVTTNVNGAGTYHVALPFVLNTPTPVDVRLVLNGTVTAFSGFNIDYSHTAAISHATLTLGGAPISFQLLTQSGSPNLAGLEQTPAPSDVPEPTTLLVTALGLVAVVFERHQKK